MTAHEEVSDSHVVLLTGRLIMEHASQ